MQSKKPLPSGYGIHHLLLPEAEAYIRKRGQRCPEDIATLVCIGCYPGMIWDDATRDTFQRYYSRRPDGTLDLLRFIRGRLAQWRRTRRGYTILFLLDRTFMFDKKRLVRKRNGYVSVHRPDVTTRDLLTRPVRDVDDPRIEDGELAATIAEESGLKITEDNVKEARAFLRRKVKI